MLSISEIVKKINPDDVYNAISTTVNISLTPQHIVKILFSWNRLARTGLSVSRIVAAGSSR